MVGVFPKPCFGDWPIDYRLGIDLGALYCSGGAMNLREGNGRVPVPDSDGYRLVPMPDRETFNTLLPHRSAETLDKIWSIVNMRLSGKRLREVASAHQISGERVRQIEANFQRRLSTHLSKLS